jgi:hypothetical protein
LIGQPLSDHSTIRVTGRAHLVQKNHTFGPIQSAKASIISGQA